MQSNSFLQSVARTFLSKGEEVLKDYCFIFPNRRSSVFFEKELVDNAKSAFILPHITTISDFVCDITHMVECSRIELMLDLYEEYKGIIGENCEPFDEFCYWGDIILNDFNDVDLYLVDSDSMFVNLKEYKEIGTDYLSEEQKSALNEYFGESVASRSTNVEKFWKHTSAYKSGCNNSEKYFYLWELLGELYRRFNSRLALKGVSYSGHIYRKAVDRLKAVSVEDLEFKQYVFVGFNVLSTSEVQMFNILKDKKLADFYWDLNSPALRDSNNKATRFLSRNIKAFRSKYTLDEPQITSFPQIKVNAIPGNVGQVKCAVDIVKQLIADGKIKDDKDLLNTAIVLPDENLFIPLTGSIDKNIINKVNVTMGFPLKKSLVSTLLTAVSKVHRQARKIKGEFFYYIEDVKGLVSHPYIKLMASGEVQQLLQTLAKDRKFFVSVETIKESCPTFWELFSPVTSMSLNDLIGYTDNILNFLVNKVTPSLETQDDKTIEITCVRKYIEQFHQLVDIIGKYTIELNENTFFYLVDRFITGSIVSLQGEPLEGLQIMGVLETRCLDFKNLIVLSMNEKVFPRKHFSRSFIPYNLRKGYGMATIEHQESMYAYYFYRMISRAENVFLLYDARTSGLGSGDPSRFVQQLCKIYTESNTKIEYVSFDISSSKDLVIEVPKTPRIMEKLNVYRTKDSGKFLSASAINSYIACPLKFYFEKVEGLRIQDEITEFMNYSTFGTIIHEIMNEIYTPFINQLITGDYLSRYLKNEGHCLDKIIVRVVNRIYYNKGENCYDELDGEGYMIEDVIKHYVIEILKYDSNKNFVYCQGEKEESDYWDELGINFKQFIDRIDTVDDGDSTPYLRIVDYKTGNDETSVADFKSAMDNSKDKIKKAIIQIFLYCNFYNYKNKTDRRIKPLIYTVKDLSQAEIKIGRNIVDDYRDYNDDFMQNMRCKIDEMFNEDIPFMQTENDKSCQYCKYKDFCRK